MKIIKLTSLKDKKTIFINVDQIGHFYDVPEKTDSYGNFEEHPHAIVGVTTHNNGGFRVIESSQIIEMFINSNE